MSHFANRPGQFFLRPPLAKPESGGPARMRGEVNTIYCPDGLTQRSLHAILNSSLYYVFFCVFTDGRHLTELSESLDAAMRQHTSYWRKSGLLIESVDSGETKCVIDEIDDVLAEGYRFSKESLDYITNYDIKYRMGQ